MVHSTLLNHLSILEQEFLVMDFDLDGDMSPLAQYLPKTARNLKNLSHIATVNLHFNETMKFVGGGGVAGQRFNSGVLVYVSWPNPNSSLYVKYHQHHMLMDFHPTLEDFTTQQNLTPHPPTTLTPTLNTTTTHHGIPPTAKHTPTYGYPVSELNLTLGRGELMPDPNNPHPEEQFSVNRALVNWWSNHDNYLSNHYGLWGTLYISGHQKDWAKATSPLDLNPRILLDLSNRAASWADQVDDSTY